MVAGFLSALPTIISSGILPVHQLPDVGCVSKGCNERVRSFFEARGMIMAQMKSVYTSCALLVNAIAYQWVKLDDDVLPLINKAMASTGRSFTITRLSGISTLHMHTSLTTDIALLAFASQTIDIPPAPDAERYIYVYYLPVQDVTLLKRKQLKLELLQLPKEEYQLLFPQGHWQSLLAGCLPELLQLGKLRREHLPATIETSFGTTSDKGATQPLGRVLCSPVLREVFVNDLQRPEPLHTFLFEGPERDEFYGKLLRVVNERTLPLLKRGIVDMPTLLAGNTEFLSALPQHTASLLLDGLLSWAVVEECAKDFKARGATRASAVCSQQVCKLLKSGFLQQEQLLTLPPDLLTCLQMRDVIDAISSSQGDSDIFTIDPIVVHFVLVLNNYWRLHNIYRAKTEEQRQQEKKGKEKSSSTADYNLDQKDHPGIQFTERSPTLPQAPPTFADVKGMSTFEVFKLLVDKFGVKLLRDVMCEASPIYHSELAWTVTLLSKHVFQGLEAGVITFEQLVDPDLRPNLRTIVMGMPVLMEKFLTLEDLPLMQAAPFAMSLAGLRAFRSGVITKESLLEMDDDTRWLYQSLVCTMPVLELLGSGKIALEELLELPAELRTVQYVKLMSVPDIDHNYLREHEAFARKVPLAFIDYLVQGKAKLEDFYALADRQGALMYFAAHLLESLPFSEIVKLPDKLLPELTPALMQLIKDCDIQMRYIQHLWESDVGPASSNVHFERRGQAVPHQRLLNLLIQPAVRAALVDKVLTVEQLLDKDARVLRFVLSESGMTLLREGLSTFDQLAELSVRVAHFVCSPSGVKVLRSGTLTLGDLRATTHNVEALQYGVLVDGFLEGLLPLHVLDQLDRGLEAVSKPVVLGVVRAGVVTYAQIASILQACGHIHEPTFFQRLFTPKNVQAIKTGLMTVEQMTDYLRNHTPQELVQHVEGIANDSFLLEMASKERAGTQPIMAFSFGNTTGSTTSPSPTKYKEHSRRRGKRDRK